MKERERRHFGPKLTDGPRAPDDAVRGAGVVDRVTGTINGIPVGRTAAGVHPFQTTRARTVAM